MNVEKQQFYRLYLLLITKCQWKWIKAFNDIRNLYDPKSVESPIITAFISVNKKEFLNFLSEDFRVKYQDIENFKEIEISRNLDTKEYTTSGISDSKDSSIIGKEIVSRLPYIIYNDDFIERPKNMIDIPEQKDNLSDWIDIYEWMKIIFS